MSLLSNVTVIRYVRLTPVCKSSDFLWVLSSPMTLRWIRSVKDYQVLYKLSGVHAVIKANHTKCQEKCKFMYTCVFLKFSVSLKIIYFVMKDCFKKRIFPWFLIPTVHCTLFQCIAPDNLHIALPTRAEVWLVAQVWESLPLVCQNGSKNGSTQLKKKSVINLRKHAVSCAMLVTGSHFHMHMFFKGVTVGCLFA